MTAYDIAITFHSHLHRDHSLCSGGSHSLELSFSRNELQKTPNVQGSLEFYLDLITSFEHDVSVNNHLAHGVRYRYSMLKLPLSESRTRSSSFTLK